MMKDESLSHSLMRWTGFPKLGPEFEPRHCFRAANHVQNLFQDMRPRIPSGFDLHRLYRRAVDAYENRSLADMNPRHLRQLPWVLFYPPSSADRKRNWLGGKHKVLMEYRRWLQGGHRTRSVLTLLHEFLRVYPVDLKTFDDLRELLRDLLVDGNSHRTPLPSAARKWAERCRSFQLLDADKGYGFVQNYISATPDSNEYMNEAGFGAGLSRCNFLRSGIRASLSNCERRLAQDTCEVGQLERLLALLVFENELRFDERTIRAEVATALLSPFAERSPPADTKQVLQSFFLRHYGDPRLPSGKHKWSGISDVRTVVIRWLVERVLDQFFVLLKETAFDKHWRYREAFWRAFLEENLIYDIWFALGPYAGNMLKTASRDPNVLQTTGQLRGAQSAQSVLLMKMPGVVIAEWSHNGSCHMWLDGMPGAPKLYQKEYYVSQVRRPYPYPQEYGICSQRHDGSVAGRWQDAIVDWLRKNTEIEVDRNLYFPRELRNSSLRPRTKRAERRKFIDSDKQHRKNRIKKQTSGKIKTRHGLPSYKTFKGSAGPDPRHVATARVADGLCRIIRVEGPVLAKRAYRIYLRGCGIHETSRSRPSKRAAAILRRHMNRALQHAMREGRVVIEDERCVGGLVYLIVRAPDTPPVIARQCGPRHFSEIPPSEVQLVARQVRLGRENQLGVGSGEHFRTVLAAFGISNLTAEISAKLSDGLKIKYPYVDDAISAIARERYSRATESAWIRKAE